MQKQFGSALFGRAAAYIFISPALLSFDIHLSVWSPFSRFYICDSILLKGKKGADRGMGGEKERERGMLEPYHKKTIG